ncbi:uncharacterized protein LOC141569379 [Rhinolophus sinicus]|uniref:uncharacterized protein LOC141569379 n=1 Tax=Rhinolophus sinicus TaxID=89399 RepID=UPI003D7AFA14
MEKPLSTGRSKSTRNRSPLQARCPRGPCPERSARTEDAESRSESPAGIERDRLIRAHAGPAHGSRAAHLHPGPARPCAFARVGPGSRTRRLSPRTRSTVAFKGSESWHLKRSVGRAGEKKDLSRKGEERKKPGLVRDLNPGPLAPEARIIPLDQRAALGSPPPGRALQPRSASRRASVLTPTRDPSSLRGRSLRGLGCGALPAVRKRSGEPGRPLRSGAARGPRAPHLRPRRLPGARDRPAFLPAGRLRAGTLSQEGAGPASGSPPPAVAPCGERPHLQLGPPFLRPPRASIAALRPPLTPPSVRQACALAGPRPAPIPAPRPQATPLTVPSLERCARVELAGHS